MTKQSSFILLVLGLMILAGVLIGIIYYQTRLTQPATLSSPDTVTQEPIDLYYEFKQQLADQTVSEIDLLTTYLAVLNGNKTVTDLQLDTPVTLFEITPLVRRAKALLDDPDLPDDKKVALQQEVDQLIEPAEQITIVSDSADAVSAADKNWLIPAAVAVDICEEGKNCYNQTSVFDAGEYIYHIMADVSLPTEVANTFTPVIEQALHDSYAAYAPLGVELDDIYVFLKPSASLLEQNDLIFATAETATVFSDKACRIDIWRTDTIAAHTSTAIVKQIIAHEIFHCISSNTWQQQYRGARLVNDWWVEGAAEYFSNYVYPTTNHEYTFNAEFAKITSNTPLYYMVYESNIFFQYLYQRIGNQGILALIASLPTSGNDDNQSSALAAYANMEELWHQFGQAYLNQSILDSSGSIRPLTALSYDTMTVDAETILRSTADPFLFTVRQYQFQPPMQTVFALSTEESDPGRHATQETGTTDWTEWPKMIGISKSCNSLDIGISSYLLLMTAVDSDPYELTVTVAEESLRDKQTPEALSLDPCLIGRWQADETSAKEAFSELLYKMDIATDFTITEFDYVAQSCIQNDNTISSQLDYLVQFVVDVPGDELIDQETQVKETLDMDITSLGVYSADGSTLSIYAPKQTGYATVQTEFVGYSNQTDVLQPPPPVIELTYNCSGNQLELELPISPYPKMVFKKMTP